MNPNGPSSFDDDDGVPGSPPRTQVQPPGAPVREKPITAERSGSMARITKTYPQQEGTVFPRELLEFAIDAAREGYVRTANMGAAFNIMKRQVKDRWTMEKGPSGYVFKEHIHPLESYLRPSVRHDEAHKPAPPAPREKPAVPESGSVAEARKRWDTAKTSGDAGAMTRAANDLLRAVEADRAARGESDPHQVGSARRDSISDILAPVESRSVETNSNSARKLDEATAGAVGRGAAAAEEIFALPDLQHTQHEGAHSNFDMSQIANFARSTELAELIPAGRAGDEALPQILSEEAKARAAAFAMALTPALTVEFLKHYKIRFGEVEAGRLLESMAEPMVRADDIPAEIHRLVPLAKAADEEEDSRSPWKKILD